MPTEIVEETGIEIEGKDLFLIVLDVFSPLENG